MCIFYVTLGNGNVILLEILSLIYTVYIMIKCIVFLPYYNIFENCIESCKMAAVSLSILIFLFANLLDNATVIAHFNIILQPIAIYMVCRIIKRRYLKLKECKDIPKNQYEFELKYRDLLTNPNLEDKTQVLSLFKRFSEMCHFQKNKLFAIWEFNFCFHVIKDERLARVKLSKISKNSSSLEGDAYEWKIFNWLCANKKLIFFSDINYLTYLMELSSVRAKDEELCYIVIDLEGEFSQRKPRIERIVDLVDHISDSIGIIKKGYKNIAEKHKTTETLELYAGFLGDILGNYDEADQIASKKNGMSVYNQRNEDKRLEKYGRDIATMLISCSDESFGNILYINEKAIQILKTSLIPSQELKFTNFLPAPYDVLHLKLAKDFLTNCSSTDLEDHKRLFFEDQRGYIMECNLLIKLTAFHDSAYFLVSFQQKKKDHQLAIVSQEGIIQSHTELFPYYVGQEKKLLKNKNLSDLIPALSIEKMQDYEPWITIWETRELAFIKIPKKIKSIVVYLLIVAYNEEEISKWKTGEAQEQLDMISDQDVENNEESYSDKRERKRAEIKCHSIGEVTFSMKSIDKTETDIFTQNMDSSMMKDQKEHERSLDEEHSKPTLSKKSNFY
ncbi:unnamed protein product [Blepharisma stoltei]|uniref:Uncharacterized protein n=1 Tax=Blepharisma stoltei TaxID=1481888 RepID=A0AAU9IZM2_9CILI|nr:unnamed protein product [Blepharisma stoltei]